MRFLLFLLLACPSFGQAVKPAAAEADYHRWGTLEVGQLSETGQWASYSMRYEGGRDTLFVQNTATMRTYSFPNGFNGQFAGDKMFFCQDKDGALLGIDFKTGIREKIDSVGTYHISDNQDCLIARQGNGLMIKDLHKKKWRAIPGVSQFSFHPQADAVVYAVAGQLLLSVLDDRFETEIIAHDAGNAYSDFVWTQDGASVAFLIKGRAGAVGCYRLKEKRLYLLDAEKIDRVAKEYGPYELGGLARASDDGTKVFLQLAPVRADTVKPSVQLWNSAARSLYPEKLLIKGWSAVSKVGAWHLQTGGFAMVTTDSLPYATFTGDYKKALVFDPIAGEPQFLQTAPLDLYIKDLQHGGRELFLKGQSDDQEKMTVSPKGKYIAYYREKNWWLYDIARKTHSNLTESLGATWENEEYDRSGEKPIGGIGGWLEDEAGLLLYDSYDVWLVAADGIGSRRLTKGREAKARYRIEPIRPDQNRTTSLNWTQSGAFRLSDGLVLKAVSATHSGYFQWHQKSGLKELAWSENNIRDLRVSKGGDVCIFTEEHYHLPPRLKVRHKTNTPKMVFQSNAHYAHFAWGFSRLMTYHDSKGNVLRGALYYPANFDPKKRYPMVVKIYEKLAAGFNQYVNPGNENDAGFNVSNFTSRGYFVLLPDIAYEEGKPGYSAVDCVSSAVREVIAMEPVDPKKIGLIGHSFGGYQTNFIITQTDLFAAAVSGSGVFDLVSNYLSVAWNIGKPNGWRYESQQFRMGVSLFEDRERYENNSPVTFVHRINTPVFSWTGNADFQVYFHQSLEFHLAMRRLQKPATLAIYEGEKHLIKSKAHQADLTHRIQDWFEYYLKGAPKSDWMEKEHL